MAATATLTRSAPSYRQSAPQTIVKYRTRKAPAKKHHRRKSHSMASSLTNLGSFALAGYLLGMLDKAGTAIPTIPVLGKAGTLAVGLHFLGKGNKMMSEASLAAAAIAGYEMGSLGKVSGMHGVFGSPVVPQVSGIASQV
jgi:hypothetical protein